MNRFLIALPFLVSTSFMSIGCSSNSKITDSISQRAAQEAYEQLGEINLSSSDALGELVLQQVDQEMDRFVQKLDSDFQGTSVSNQ
jgi:uncharacterized membrane protein YdfJ with MMPL/SSD domain